jgi:cell division protein FtsB
VTSKLALLESELPPRELEENDQLARLRERADELEAEMSDLLDEFDSLEEAFENIGRYPG